MPAHKPVRHVLIVAHKFMPEAEQELVPVQRWFSEQGISAVFGALHDAETEARVAAGEFDLLVALGGDGTMLRAGHLAAPFALPILGINLGRFGFLIEVSRQEWREKLPLLVEGNYWLEKRMMLRADHWRDKTLVDTWHVLNEVVVGRGQTVRPIHLTTCLDGSFLTTYVADGLIVSTPTGSTAYALAVGGPIMPPELRSILIVPVAPHLSVDRAVILAEGSSVNVTVHTNHQAVLSPDGQPSVPLNDGDQVNVAASERSVHFVRFQDPNYFYRNLTSHMNRNPSAGPNP